MKLRVWASMLAVLRWSGVVTCGVLAIVWMFSGCYQIRYDARYSDGVGVRSMGFDIAGGRFGVYRWADPRGMTGWPGPAPGWKWDRSEEPVRWEMWFGGYDTSGGFSTDWAQFVPLWIPALVFGSATTAIWRVRRTRLDQCPCGYSRAGLRPDQCCPECGQNPKPRVTPELGAPRAITDGMN
jgi:hypothetical protein